MRQEIENIVNRLSIRGGYSTDEAIDDILELIEIKQKEKDDTINLLENRLKGFKLHYCIDELKEENKKLRADKLDFADWICKSGWIIRPFPESDVYLFDDHSTDNLEELYDNPKTLMNYTIYLNKITK